MMKKYLGLLFFCAFAGSAIAGTVTNQNSLTRNGYTIQREVTNPDGSIDLIFFKGASRFRCPAASALAACTPQSGAASQGGVLGNMRGPLAGLAALAGSVGALGNNPVASPFNTAQSVGSAAPVGYSFRQLLQRGYKIVGELKAANGQTDPVVGKGGTRYRCTAQSQLQSCYAYNPNPAPADNPSAMPVGYSFQQLLQQGYTITREIQVNGQTDPVVSKGSLSYRCTAKSQLQACYAY